MPELKDKKIGKIKKFVYTKKGIADYKKEKRKNKKRKLA